MNKKVFVIITVVLLAIVGGVLYLDQSSSKQPVDQNTTAETSTQQPVDQPNEQTNTSAAPGAYIDYKPDTIANTSGTKLLFFHAPWCPQCRALETDIKKQGVPSGATIIKVDYDSNQKLRQKYGVTIQTTFVKINDSGELVEKFTAYDDPTLKAVTDKLL